MWKDKCCKLCIKELEKKKFLKNQNWEERNFWIVQVVILLLNFIFQNLSAHHKIPPTIYHSKGGWLERIKKTRIFLKSTIFYTMFFIRRHKKWYNFSINFVPPVCNPCHHFENISQWWILDSIFKEWSHLKKNKFTSRTDHSIFEIFCISKFLYLSFQASWNDNKLVQYNSNYQLVN